MVSLTAQQLLYIAPPCTAHLCSMVGPTQGKYLLGAAGALHRGVRSASATSLPWPWFQWTSPKPAADRF